MNFNYVAIVSDKGSDYSIHFWWMNHIFVMVCHGLMQKDVNFNYVAIVSEKGSDYRIQFWYISKADAINIMKNSNLNEKSGSLQIFLLYIKMGETTYCQRNREIILNRAKEYYENNKEVLQKKQKISIENYLMKKRM